MPKVYIIPQMQPNAFATGRNPSHAAVAATEGLLRMLTKEELRGVMAHEVAHIVHRDILTQTIVSSESGLASLTFCARGSSSPSRNRAVSPGSVKLQPTISSKRD